jgi:hypothetical protein
LGDFHAKEKDVVLKSGIAVSPMIGIWQGGMQSDACVFCAYVLMHD